MKKQQLPFFTLILFAFLTGLCTQANAGQTSIPGTTEESSPFSGDTFNPNPEVTSPQIAPDLEATIGLDGRIRVPGEVQKNINCAFSSSDTEFENLRSEILSLLSNGSDATVQNQVQKYISSLGVSSELTTSLVSALSGMIDSTAADRPGVPTSLLKLRPVQLVADNRNSRDQSSPQCISNVDVNKLNNAINAYNKIVQKSDLQVLKKLSKESNFILIGKVLKDLRIAMNRP